MEASLARIIPPSCSRDGSLYELLRWNALVETRELLERLRMVVDPQVEIGVVLGRVDEERGRLLAALVAAGVLAGF